MATIELKNSAGEVIGTVDEAEWAAMPAADRQAALSEYDAEPPTERVRAALQGLTLGFSDELEALEGASTNYLFGDGDFAKKYDEVLTLERDALKNYREAYPMSSMGWELAGAAIPAIFSGGAGAGVTGTRMASTPGLVNAVAGAARGGAVAGGVYGFGSGEGGFNNRTKEATVGAVVGAAAGPVLAAGVRGAGAITKKAVDWARNKGGDKIAGVVSREVQRMVELYGLTADEIVDGVANGRIMAENRTLDKFIRRFYAEGGPAGAEIGKVLLQRPAATRSAAMDELQGALGSPGNPLASRRASDAITREAEGAAYEGAFRAGDVDLPLPAEMLPQLENVARRVPGALKDAADIARVKHGMQPYFDEAADGSVIFTREPTLREAELVYRSLRDRSDEAFKSSRGTLGEAMRDLASAFKASLDAASPALSKARSDAAGVRRARDSFLAGQKAIGKSPDELALIVADIEALGPEAMEAFREGLLASIRAGVAKPAAAPALLRGLANDGTGPGTALRLALPPQRVDAAVGKISIADDAQRAASSVMGGSATAATELSPRVGGVVSAGQAVASGMGGDLWAWARLIGTAADQLKPGLSDAQKLEVARIVLSTDPDLVSRALKDTNGVAMVTGLTSMALDKLVRAGTRSSGPGLLQPLQQDKNP